MDEDRLAKWIIISFSFEEFSERTLQRPLLIAEVQDTIRELDLGNRAIADVDLPPHLREYLEDRRLVSLLSRGKLFPSDEESISVYTHLSASTQPRRPTASDFRGPSAAAEGMVLVPAGKFLMGDVSRASTLDAFEIDLYPVTNRQFQRFRDESGYTHVPSHWRDGAYPAEKADHPVVNVSLDDCDAYAKWAKKRLPTEQEWEKAARGPSGRKFTWGNAFNRQNCNNLELGLHDTSEVSGFPNGVSQYGVYDMCGNAWEWTATSVRPDNEDARVIRGGSWASPKEGVQATTRGYERVARRRRDLGFRCVKDGEHSS